MSKKTDEKPAIKKQLKREEKEEEVNIGADKTAFLYVEKVASAIEYVVDNFNDLMPKGPLGRALDKIANDPGEGAGSLTITKSSKPRADYAKKDKMAVTEDASTPKTQRGEQGKTKDTLDKKPGGGLLKTEPFVNKPTVSKEAAHLAVLAKLAGEDVLKAKIKAGNASSTSMKTYEANQSAGTPPGHDQSGYGNENEHYIMDNDSARSYTKRDAKLEYNKREVGRAFNEVNPGKDTALDRAWSNGRNTAKLAEFGEQPEKESKEEKPRFGNFAPSLKKKKPTQEEQEKAAEAVEQGCTCDDAGTCTYCKSKAAVMKKLAMFKRANELGAPPPTGGEDPAMAAQAGGPPQMGPKFPPPPDCMCGGQGTCLPCKKMQMQMIMAQAKGQGGAPPPGGDPSGAGPGMAPDQPPVM